MTYLLKGTLPKDKAEATELTLQATLYTVVDDILYYIGNSPKNVAKVVVPPKLRQDMIKDYHTGIMAGHFSGPKIYQEMLRRWWWKYMYSLRLS